MTTRFPAALLLSLHAAACVGPADNAETAVFVGRQGPIVFGDDQLEEKHRAVVAIAMGHRGMCSGTLITQRVVLTAAHCVDGARVNRILVGFGTDIESPTMEWMPISEALVHPDYDADWPAYDIALLRLAQNAPSDINPIPYLPATLGITQADVGVNLEFAGFGQTEAGESGQLLRVNDAVGLVCERAQGCLWGGALMAPETICYDQQPGGPCSGDSGGPAFVERNGQLFVAGVTSYGDQDCAHFGCSTKVDSFEDFIAPFLTGSNGTTCDEASECDSGFCVDGFCCESACDGGCTTCGSAEGRGRCLARPDGTLCDDGSLCSKRESCFNGQCLPEIAVACERPTTCRPAIECNPATGTCGGPPAPDGTVCESGGICSAGECVDPPSCGGCSGTGLEAAWALLLLPALRRRRR